MLRIVEKVLLLQDFREFHRASTEQLAKLCTVATERRVPAGERLFARGDAAQWLFLLVQGKVSLDSGVGTQVVEQAALDMCSVFSQRPHGFSARTLEPSVVLVVSYDNLVDLLEVEPEFCWAITRYLAEQMCEYSAEPATSFDDDVTRYF
jgi:CRP-like cAMP-binding protein